MIRFAFNEQKAAEAAAHMIQLHGGRLSVLALIKLLYLGDRTALAETGMPITGDMVVAMRHGPVLSHTYDCTKTGQIISNTPWGQYVEPHGRVAHHVVLAQAPPEDGLLSDYEIQVLRRVHEEFGHLDRWKLVDFVHTLPEWHDPGATAIPITFEEILCAIGKSDDDIAAIAEQAEEALDIERVFPAAR